MKTTAEFDFNRAPDAEACTHCQRKDLPLAFCACGDGPACPRCFTTDDGQNGIGEEHGSGTGLTAAYRYLGRRSN